LVRNKPSIDWSRLDFAAFARLAEDARLSKYEKIGFPDSYRLGLEGEIFADIRRKLPRLEDRERIVLDIGPGCSDLPHMLIDLCGIQAHALYLVDSPEMLALLPDAAFIVKRPGQFPGCRELLADLRQKVDVIVSYSVLHYVMAEANVFAFLDACLELLRPGGELLIGDIPNVSKRRRFFASDSGIAFHRAFTGTDTLPDTATETARGSLDDATIAELLLRARAAGADAYVLPQPSSLPMANRREDILIRKP
jgi:SAM-dependent methyltransferase